MIDRVKPYLGSLALLLFILSYLVGNNGENWGIAPDHLSTVEGLLTLLGFGVVAYYGYLLWQDSNAAREE